MKREKVKGEGRGKIVWGMRVEGKRGGIWRGIWCRGEEWKGKKGEVGKGREKGGLGSLVGEVKDK